MAQVVDGEIMQKNKKGLYSTLYKMTLGIILGVILIPTMLSPAPLLVFLVFSMYIGPSFGVIFLVLNIYGIFKFKTKRIVFVLISCGTTVWAVWGLINVIKGINLP